MKKNIGYHLIFPLKGILMNDDLLCLTLDVAVPLWIQQIKKLPFDLKQKRALECSQIIAEKGDIILFKSNKKGETAKAFNCLAEALAILAYLPNGVKFGTRHWEVKKEN